MNAQTLDRIRFVTRHFNELQGLRTSVPLGLILVSLGAMAFFPSWPLLLLQLMVILGCTVLVFRVGPYYGRAFGEVERQPVFPEAEPPSIFSPAGPAPTAVDRRPVKPALRLLIPITLACALFLILRATVPSALLETDGSGVNPWVQLNPPVVYISETPVLPRSWLDLKPVLGQGMYALFGAFFLGVWLWRERRFSQSYYLALGAVLLGLAALGVSLGVVVPATLNLGIYRVVSFCLPALAHVWMALILCGAAMFFAGLLDHWQIARVLKPVAEEPA